MKTMFLALILPSILIGCGSDNKIADGSPIDPPSKTNPSNTKESNLLKFLDPSFENVVNDFNHEFKFRVTDKKNAMAMGPDADSFVGAEGDTDFGDKYLHLYNLRRRKFEFPVDQSLQLSPLALEAGARYLFTAYVKQSKNSRRTKGRMKFSGYLEDDDGVSAHVLESTKIDFKQNPGQWQQVSIEFEVPSHVNGGTFRLNFDPFKEILLDAMELKKIAMPE